MRPDTDPASRYLVARVYSRIPLTTVESLVAYLDERRAPGGFLTAVLENDLVGAIGRADEENLASLADLVTLLYNHAPAFSWGDAGRVSAWLADTGERITSPGMDAIRSLAVGGLH